MHEQAEEKHLLNNEVVDWRSCVDRLNSENEEHKEVISDLEMKNRKLVEKLNEFIYNKAAEYKQRTL